MNRASTQPDDPGLPSGWRRSLLKDLCSSMQAGPALSREERTGADGVRLVLPRDLTDQRIAPTENTAVTWDKARRLERFRLEAGDILVTRTGTVGRCALVTEAESGWLYHPNLLRLRLDEADRSSAPYLTGYLSAGVAQQWVEARATRSVIPSISTRVLGELPVLLPPPAEQQAIGATLAALDDKIRAHNELARVTAEYRSALADGLMTGVLSVRP